MKKLVLKKETLADLTIDELRAVAGGAGESASCPITYQCIVVGSIACTGVSNGCTVFGTGVTC
jgi:hypothetical protein